MVFKWRQVCVQRDEVASMNTLLLSKLLSPCLASKMFKCSLPSTEICKMARVVGDEFVTLH